METEVDLIAIISSVCVNIQKQTRYIFARTQQSMCVISTITLKSQTVSARALVNYWILLQLKFTTIDVFWKYIKTNKKKLEM